MRHHRNLSLGEPSDQVKAACSAFDLDCLGAGFFNETCRVGYPFRSRHLVGPEGHVGDHHRVFDRPPYGAGVQQHLVHGDGECVVIAHDHHGQGISHQDEVDARLVHQPCGGVVVRGEGDDGSPVSFLILKGLNGYRCDPGGGRGLIRACGNA